MTAMPAKTQSPLTVYYDGGCPVCRREIGFYARRTGDGVSYCDVASEVCPAPDLKREDALKRFHVRLADGALVSGAAAFLALWRATPGFRLPARLLSARPVVAALDVAYDGFLKIRRLWR
jgi:predicted DCC family thiol-disulfide oxidoreductase YuxK